MPDKPVFGKKCPKCGHPALEHKQGKPGETTIRYNEPRYCWHPDPAPDKNDAFTFCMCKVEYGDYIRVGNHALIRISG
jgi:acetyltransferase-like isoleucine patch superfamily enzyme